MVVDFIKNIIKVCEVLNKNEVNYLIVGGTATAFHGYYRMSRMPDGTIASKHDFDFWYDPSYENYFKLLNALEALGLNVSTFKNEQMPNPKKSFFTHEFKEFKIDFLPEILGLNKFQTSFSKKITSVIEGIEIYILSEEDLIIAKEKTGRTQDEEDIAALKKLKSK